MLKNIINRKYLNLLPVYTLLFIVIVQFFLSHFSTLSPWKGGGFAMFGAISRRSINCKILTKNNHTTACLIRFHNVSRQGELDKAFKKSLLQYPTEDKLKILAENYLYYQLKLINVSELNLPLKAKKAFINTKQILKTQNNNIKAIKLEIYETIFDNKTAEVKAQSLGVKYTFGEWN